MKIIQGQNTPLIYKSKFNLAEATEFSAWLTQMGEKRIIWDELKIIDGEYVQLLLTQTESLNLRSGSATLDAKYVIDGAVCFEQQMPVNIVERDNETIFEAGISENGTEVEEAEPVEMPIYNKGLDGVSPTVRYETTSEGLVVVITDKDGEHRALVPKGRDGKTPVKGLDYTDGYSPSIDVVVLPNGHKVRITDKDGEKSFEVLNGKDYVLTEADKQYIASFVHVEEKHITEYIENPYDDSEIKKDIKDLGDGVRKQNEDIADHEERIETLENETPKDIFDDDIVSNEKTWTSEKIKKEIDKVGNICYGFHVNEDESNPSDRVRYIADAQRMTPAHMNYTTGLFEYGSWGNAFFMPRPCMLYRDGTVAYYLDEFDYAKKEDGTDSDVGNLDFDGNAMMEWGKDGRRIYYKLTPDSVGNGWNCYIANYKVDDNFVCWSFINNQDELVDHFYTPIYNGSLDENNCLRSISGQPIMLSKSGTNEIIYAKNNNKGSDVLWYTETWADRTLIDLLLILMGKSTNYQVVFGQGHTTGGSQAVLEEERTGSLNDKGLFYGYSSTTNAVKVFGMENWWGCQYRRLAGLILYNNIYYQKFTYGVADGSTANGYTTTQVGMIEGETSPTANGYQKTNKIIGDSFLPVDVTASSTTYWCDYFYQNTGTRYALVGGSSAHGAYCGRCVALSNTVGGTNWAIGASVSCKPLVGG